MADLGSARASSGLGDFDYTFTDKELQDVLGYMERQQSGVLDPLPFFANPTALQFQPHVTSPMDFAIKPEVFDMLDMSGLALGGTSSPMAPPQPLVPTHQQPLQSAPLISGPSGSSSSSGVPAGAMAHLPPALELASASAAHLPSLVQLPPQPQPQPHQHPLQQNAQAARNMAQQQALLSLVQQRKDGKVHISHSTVEKQRRDRINSLIDELRELVPPSRHEGGCMAGQPSDPQDVKRPKHVVLSDTIAMVRELQERLTMSESRLARLREHEEHCPFHEHEHHQAILRAADRENSSGSRDSHPELPHAPEGILAAAEPAVCVEEGDSCMYVKVSCKDRHGLLADIVRSLKAIPVEIITAAITTTKDGGVYDVFQVTPEEGTAVTQQDIRSCIEHVLESHHTGDKRRRDC